MKRSMVDYVNEMSGDDIDTFENIITYHYRKFTRFYNLVNSFSEDIENIHYTFESPEELNVTLLFTKKSNVKDFKRVIDEKIVKNGYNAVVETDNKVLDITLILDEDIV